MRKSLVVLTAVAGLCALVTAAHAALIRVNLSNQTMHVSSASGDYTWPISSARAGFVTPNGTYGVQRLEAMHYSRKYHNSPMPHSIFFRGGYAIHGTFATASLGAPASHGCIRLSPSHAATLYQIVSNEGARISISGSPDLGARYARAERRHYRTYASRRYAAPPLAYAPRAEAPSFRQWMRAPDGYWGTAPQTDDADQ